MIQIHFEGDTWGQVRIQVDEFLEPLIEGDTLTWTETWNRLKPGWRCDLESET